MPEKHIIRGTKACVFDAYGTLFDIHSTVAQYRGRLGEKADAVAAQWIRKQQEYTWLRSLMKKYTDFYQIIQDALDFVLDQHDLNDADLRKEMVDSYLRLKAYPEVTEALSKLRARGYESAILSNGTPSLLAYAVGNSELDSMINKIFSAESAGVFKPDPRVYQLVVKGLKLKPDQVAYISANGWDVAGASTFGFQAIWVNRYASKEERLPGNPMVEMTNMMQLLEVLI